MWPFNKECERLCLKNFEGSFCLTETGARDNTSQFYVTIYEFHSELWYRVTTWEHV